MRNLSVIVCSWQESWRQLVEGPARSPIIARTFPPKCDDGVERSTFYSRDFFIFVRALHHF